MDTKIVPIVIPVLRIWERDQLQIAQDTLGWLAGSSWGGQFDGERGVLFIGTCLS